MSEFNEMQKRYIDKQAKLGDKFVMDLQYEPLYDYIKTDREYIWNQYYDDIKVLTANLCKRYNLPFDEIMGDNWIYFNKVLDTYTPIYNGGFIPLKNRVLGYLFQTQRGNIQANQIKANRELLQRNDTTGNGNAESEPVLDFIDKNSAVTDEYFSSELSRIINKFPDDYKFVITNYVQGKKQREIAEIMGLTQSRISIMLTRIKDAVFGNKKRDINGVNKICKELYNYCHE